MLQLRLSKRNLARGRAAGWRPVIRDRSDMMRDCLASSIRQKANLYAEQANLGFRSTSAYGAGRPYQLALRGSHILRGGSGKEAARIVAKWVVNKSLPAPPMLLTAEQPDALAGIRVDLGAIFVSIELSKSTWPIASLLAERLPRSIELTYTQVIDANWPGRWIGLKYLRGPAKGVPSPHGSHPGGGLLSRRVIRTVFSDEGQLSRGS